MNLIHDGGIEGNEVPIGESEDRIQMHGRGSLGMLATITRSAAPLANSAAASWEIP
jgi:hypothetical protein